MSPIGVAAQKVAFEFEDGVVTSEPYFKRRGNLEGTFPAGTQDRMGSETEWVLRPNLILFFILSEACTHDSISHVSWARALMEVR